MGKEILQASPSDGRKLINFHQHDSVKQIVRAELCRNKFFSVPSMPFLAKGKKNSGASDEDIWAIQNHFGREITGLLQEKYKNIAKIHSLLVLFYKKMPIFVN